MDYQSKEIKALRILNQNLFDLSVNPLAAMNFNEKNDAFDVVEDAVEKYVKHKEIEEELGIDLLTLFKAMKDGYYVKSPINNCIFRKHQSYCDDGIYYDSLDGFAFNTYLKTKDYGKTWALTEEELL